MGVTTKEINDSHDSEEKQVVGKNLATITNRHPRPSLAALWIPACELNIVMYFSACSVLIYQVLDETQDLVLECSF